MKARACDQCPWRLENQGRLHKRGSYTKANLRRLWNQIRRGGRPQSCHLTDPSHPDHAEAGAKPGARAQECPGSVIVVLREAQRVANADGVVTPESCDRYLAARKRGLTKQGILYWLVARMQFGGTPVGGPKLPDVDEDPSVGLPDYLSKG